MCLYEGSRKKWKMGGERDKSALVNGSLVKIFMECQEFDMMSKKENPNKTV